MEVEIAIGRVDGERVGGEVVGEHCVTTGDDGSALVANILFLMLPPLPLTLASTHSGRAIIDRDP